MKMGIGSDTFPNESSFMGVGETQERAKQGRVLFQAPARGCYAAPRRRAPGFSSRTGKLLAWVASKLAACRYA